MKSNVKTVIILRYLDNPRKYKDESRLTSFFLAKQVRKYCADYLLDISRGEEQSYTKKQKKMKESFTSGTRLASSIVKSIDELIR